jgi:hypothetical protein
MNFVLARRTQVGNHAVSNDREVLACQAMYRILLPFSHFLDLPIRICYIVHTTNIHINSTKPRLYHLLGTHNELLIAHHSNRRGPFGKRKEEA